MADEKITDVWVIYKDRELHKIRKNIFILIHSGDTSHDAAVSSWRPSGPTP